MAKTRPGWGLRLLTPLVLVILTFIAQVGAHSNVERMMRIANNGTMVGTEGYPRGFVPRTAHNFQDGDNIYLIPPNGREKVILPDDKIAHPWQRTANYSLANPLTAAPGDMIALQYQENGHTTLPDNQPNKTLNRGTVYIYGTYNLSSDANLLDIHYQWNEDGTGGDGKGKLIATRNFDDGRCYQDNQEAIATARRHKYSKPDEQPMGDNLWCQNDVALPTDLVIGKPYTMIWVWDWPTMDRANVTFPPSSAPGAAPGENGATVFIPELYTSVMDINIVDPCSDELGEVKGPTCSKSGGSKQVITVTETDLNKAAIQEQIKNMFIVDVSALIAGGSGHASNPSSPSPASDAPASSSTGTTASSSPTKTKGGHIKTTTVYQSVTTTTITVQPSDVASTGLSVAAVSSASPKVLTTTKSVYVATTTSTITPSAETGTAVASGTASASVPKVTNFLKAAERGAEAKNRRREVGQWGFGRGHYHQHA